MPSRPIPLDPRLQHSLDYLANEGWPEARLVTFRAFNPGDHAESGKRAWLAHPTSRLATDVGPRLVTINYKTWLMADGPTRDWFHETLTDMLRHELVHVKQNFCGDLIYPGQYQYPFPATPWPQPPLGGSWLPVIPRTPDYDPHEIEAYDYQYGRWVHTPLVRPLH